MAGRPPKDDSRDKQYRVRLNSVEDDKLTYVSNLTGKQKSDIFRNALEEYYQKIRLREIIQDREDEEDFDWDDDHISLQRIIDCPHCGAHNTCDFSEDCDPSEDPNRQMGSEITYEFNWENYECCECSKLMHIHGYICEYPIGAYNYESINVEAVEDEEEVE